MIDDILLAEVSREGLERAPKAVDPLQQTVATALQTQISLPELDRGKVIEALQYLIKPLPSVQVRDLRDAYRHFSHSQDPSMLVDAVHDLIGTYGVETEDRGIQPAVHIEREALRLICFDVISG